MTGFPGENGRTINPTAAARVVANAEAHTPQAIAQRVLEELAQFRQAAIEQGIDLERTVTADQGIAPEQRRFLLRSSGVDNITLLEAISPIVKPVAEVNPGFKLRWNGAERVWFTDPWEPDNVGWESAARDIVLGNVPKGFGIWYARREHDVRDGFLGPNIVHWWDMVEYPYDSSKARAALQGRDPGQSAALEAIGQSNRHAVLDRVEKKISALISPKPPTS